MAKKLESYINGKYKVDFKCVSGEIIDLNTRSSTHVESHGGTPFGNGNGGTSYTPVSVTSHVVDTQEFWIKEDDGTEACIKLVDRDVSLRTGHKVTVIRATNETSKYVYPIALINHTQKTFHKFHTGSTLNKELNLVVGKGWSILFTAAVFFLAKWLLSLEAAVYLSGIFFVAAVVRKVVMATKFSSGLNKHIESLVDGYK